MIIDIIIIAILVIALAVGLLRNPIKCAIDLVLFIGFTYLFYFILVKVEVNLLRAFNIDLATLTKDIGANITQLNSGITEIGTTIGSSSLVLIDSMFESSEFYNAVGYAAIHLAFFVIAAVLAIIFAYGIGWGIYAIFRKKARTIKKLPKRLIGMGANLLLVGTICLFVFSPVISLTNVVNQLGTYETNENIDSLNTTIDGAMVKIDEVQVYADKAEVLFTEFDDMSSTMDTLEARESTTYNNFVSMKDRIAVLKTKSLSVSDQEILNATETEFNTYYTQVEDGNTQFQSYVTEFNEKKEEVNSYRSTLTEVETSIDSYRSTLSSFQSTLTTLKSSLSQLNGYDQYLPNIFSFLGNVNLGYQNLSFTYNDGTSDVTINSTLNGVFTLVFTNLDNLLNIDLPEIETYANDSINEAYAEFEKYKTQIDDLEKEYTDYKDTFDTKVAEGNSTLDKADEALASAETIISGLEAKYN
ncbi:MAG: hypothetical protein WCR97_02465 [Bacilli bacterium]